MVVVDTDGRLDANRIADTPKPHLRAAILGTPIRLLVTAQVYRTYGKKPQTGTECIIIYEYLSSLPHTLPLFSYI